MSEQVLQLYVNVYVPALFKFVLACGLYSWYSYSWIDSSMTGFSQISIFQMSFLILFFYFYVSFSLAPVCLVFSLSLEWRQHYIFFWLAVYFDIMSFTFFIDVFGCIALSISFLPASTATVFQLLRLPCQRV